MDGHARRLAGWPNGFAIDVRSLAALRTVLALTILADLAMRAPNLRVHYSDEGIVPRPVLLERLDPWLWSLALPRWRKAVLSARNGVSRYPAGRGAASGRFGHPWNGVSSWASSLAAGFCLVYVLAWNLASVSAVSLTAETRAVGSLLGLVQSWTMFAPDPVDSTTWYAIPGTLRDGRRIDLLPLLYSGDARRVTPASEEKPGDMAGAFAGDERWRKYFENLHDAGNAHLLGPLGAYLCREWNAAHVGTPSELERLDVVYHWERNLPDQRRAPVQQAVQWEQRCGAEAP